MKLISLKFTGVLLGFILTGLLLVSGCATGSGSDVVFNSDPAAQPAPPASSSDSGTGIVKFQIGDLVIVKFSDAPQTIPNHEERIKEDGTITLPLIGSVQAAGQTALQLEKTIHDKYVPHYYLRLRCTIEYRATELKYSVLGEVRQPGPKAYYGITRVTEAIGAASGLTDFANKRNITVTRANRTQIKVNYTKAIKDPKFDPEVFPGDVINVERTVFW